MKISSHSHGTSLTVSSGDAHRRALRAAFSFVAVATLSACSNADAGSPVTTVGAQTGSQAGTISTPVAGKLATAGVSASAGSVGAPAASGTFATAGAVATAGAGSAATAGTLGAGAGTGTPSPVAGASGAAAGGGGGGAMNGIATFTAVLAIFADENNRCGLCHGMPTIGGGLVFDPSDAAGAYKALVGTISKGESGSQCAGKTYVVPSNPESSLLYEKLASATPSCGARMPANGVVLTATELATVHDWIMAGAKND